MRAAGLVGAGALLAPATGQAVNFPVSNTNNAGAGSLRGAILAANAAAGPDDITFTGAGASGTIRLTTGQIDITDDLTITGPGAAQLAISGDADNDGVEDFDLGGASDSRIFEIDDPTSSGAPLMEVSISGLTLRDGVASEFAGTPQSRSGGAIDAQQTDLTLEDMVFTGNVATEDGGAVRVTADGGGNAIAALHVSNSRFTDNRARVTGGAISSEPTKYGSGPDYATTEIVDTVVTGNRAGGDDFGPFSYQSNPSAGGVFAVKYNATIENTTIADNVALTELPGGPSGTAGGLFTGGVVRNSIIRGNEAGDSAGGARFRSAKVRSTTISGNTAGNTGGGAMSGSGKYGATRIDNSTVSGNSTVGVDTTDGGGGLMTYGYSADGPPTTIIRSSTIASNSTVNGTAGGIGLSFYEEPEEPRVEIQGSIVADNTRGGTPSDLGATAPPGVSAARAFSAGFSLIEAPAGIPLSGDPGGSNLIGVDALLGPLGSNGGPTQTHSLNPTSPAIDASQAFGFTTDQRGSPRTVAARAENSALSDGTDIGSYELQDANAPGDDDVTKPKVKVKAPKKLKLKGGKDTARAKVKIKAGDDRTAKQQLKLECKLDKGAWKKCKPKVKLKLDAGKHVLKVRATDEAGNVGKGKAKIKVR